MDELLWGRLGCSVNLVTSARWGYATIFQMQCSLG